MGGGELTGDKGGEESYFGLFRRGRGVLVVRLGMFYYVKFHPPLL